MEVHPVIVLCWAATTLLAWAAGWLIGRLVSALELRRLRQDFPSARVVQEPGTRFHPAGVEVPWTNRLTARRVATEKVSTREVERRISELDAKLQAYCDSPEPSRLTLDDFRR